MTKLLQPLLLPALLSATALGADIPHQGPSWDLSLGPLRIDATGRSLEHPDGTPFLWLADTAWELFHRLDRAEVELYLEKRRSQGFTVIQAVALAELDGLAVPNAHGARPLVDDDPARLWVTDGADPSDPKAYDYWDHVDYVFDVAARKGITIGLLPTWGDKVPKEGPAPTWGSGPQVFTPGNARAYGQALARRYGHRSNLVWINGGDRSGDLNLAVWNALAQGIREADAGRHLMTYHPMGGHSSREWFGSEPWHDFTMLQTGHQRDTDVWTRITAEWSLMPPRPVLNGEPTYEDHPLNFDPRNGHSTALDVRKYAYWSLFSGAFGHTYGCHGVWQFHDPDRKPVNWPRIFWKPHGDQPGAIDLPGAWNMLTVRRLLLSRPMAGRVPARSLLQEIPETPGEHQVATIAADRSWAMAYSPVGRPVTVDLDKMSGDAIRAWRFDPRHGSASECGLHRRPAEGGFRVSFPPPAKAPDSTPGDGDDWVLVLDDIRLGYPPPGQANR